MPLKCKRQKRQGRIFIRPCCCFPRFLVNLERQAEADLDGARAAASHRGVGNADVRGLARRTKRSGGGWIAEVRVVVRLIQDVEGLKAELTLEALGETDSFRNGEVPFVERLTPEQVARFVAEGAERRRQHDGTAVGEAAKFVKSSEVPTFCDSPRGIHWS